MSPVSGSRSRKNIILLDCVCELSHVCCVCSSVCSKSEDGNAVLGSSTGLVFAVFPPLFQQCLCQLYFYSLLLLTVILNLLKLPFQHAQSKDIFPHLCIVSDVSVVHFYGMLYYSGGKWVHIMDIIIWWLCTVSENDTELSLFHRGKATSAERRGLKTVQPAAETFLHPQ